MNDADWGQESKNGSKKLLKKDRGSVVTAAAGGCRLVVMVCLQLFLQAVSRLLYRAGNESTP